MLSGTLGAILCVTPAGLPADPISPRERLSFNLGWRFQKGDPSDAEGALAYPKIRPWLVDVAHGRSTTAPAPKALRYAEPSFDDSGWRNVDLPHDWAIEGPFKQEYPGETGKLPWWGIGWYRKKFSIPATDAGRHVFFELDGAMSYSTVWLNGHCLGGRPYGYSSYRVDLTPYLKVGGDNVIAVRLDNPTESSRWYPGGGIYRNVWLTKTSPLAIPFGGITVTTPYVQDTAATVELKIALENRLADAASVQVETALYELDAKDRRKKLAFPAVATGNLPAQGKGSFTLGGTVGRPKLWSPATPHRYLAVTTVKQNGQIVDRVETPFGIRSIAFDAKEGFKLNGKRTKMNGVCLHHDLGALGAAFNFRAQQRQLEMLKEMGCNAIRTSHNPPAPELLDLCDRMGFLVIDEFTDTWKTAKTQNGYARLFDDWHDLDLRGMIRRDRNHPSIVMWSTGNEIAEQVSEGGQAVSRMLTAIVHEEDPTRPATTGNDRPNSGMNGYPNTLDVFGYNYKPMLYGRFREANPNKPLYGSETASTVSSRGEYFFPVTNDKAGGKADFQMSSYDLFAPPWAMAPDVEFKGQDEHPDVFGEFVWTGFDYLGEPTPYNSDATVLLNYSDPAARAKAEKELAELGRITVPSRSSYFGIIDLAGFKKDRFYIYQARWRPELRMAHLLPHWNWPERVGQVTPVHLYSSGDEAELFLNGKSLGRKKRGPLEYRFRWDDVVYQPGELKAIVYKNGKRWATDTVRTTGTAERLTINADRTTIASDGYDLAYVTVAVADAKGQMIPRSKNRLTFSIEGPGEIVATDNGDATDLEPFQATSKKAYNGLCLVIVRAKKGQAGVVKLRATGDGLRAVETTIRVKK